MTQLIVNADDFGLTPGVNRAIAELHQVGAVTSTTLMARGSAAEEAIEIALCTPSLGVGCHVVLADGSPALPPQAVPHLANPATGGMSPSIMRFLFALDCGPRAHRAMMREIEAETAAQISLLQSRGLRLTHIDTHKHLHMFPSVLRPVLRAARAAGIRAIRNPFEPLWAVRATPRPSLVRFAEVLALRTLAPICRRIIAEEGFVTTRGTVAVLGTGRLDAAALAALLGSLQPGVWELVTHPGYNDADLDMIHTRLRASRDGERLALPSVKDYPGIELVSFAALQAVRPCIEALP